ncbi:hypothetical protein Tco_0596125 [Tanacetum coccineum]
MIRLRVEAPSTTTTTTYHAPTYQDIYGYDEGCCTIHLHFSTSIKDTTIRDTTTPTYTFTYSITTFSFTLILTIEESSSAPTGRPTRSFRADYGFVGTLDVEIRRGLDREIGYEITNAKDTEEIYVRLDMHRMIRLVMSCSSTCSRRDRALPEHVRHNYDGEAKDAHEALAQMVALQSQQRPARDPTHPDVPEEAGKNAISRKAPKTRTTPATTTTTTTPMTDDQLKAIIAQGVANLLVERDATRSRNGKDSHDSGTGVRRAERVTRECTYPDFMKCQPLKFNGTEGVVKLTNWFERMEIVFHISNCTVENQIKFATLTLSRNCSQTWWNSHVRTVGHDVAYAVTWTNLKKMMTDKYYPRGKIKKLEVEMWNLKVKGTDTRRSAPLLNVRLKTRESLMTHHGTIRTNDNKTRDRTLAGLTLLGLERKNLTEDLNLCAPNETITMIDSVLSNATSVTELAIWHVTIGVLQMPILLTTKGALSQVKKLLALSAKPRDISKGSVQS